MKIEVKNIHMKYQSNHVLKDITFTIPSGELFCLLGASGSGKTTLLRLIMGAISPKSGQIQIDQKPVPNKELLSSIGFMPQNDALYEELSIWDNLKFFAGLQKCKGNDFRREAEALLKIIGLFEERKKLVRNCSGGMKKRISLGAALLHRPKLLLLDEPTVGIDPVLRRKIWNYLKELQATGTTIIVTTHVMDEVVECGFAALLRDGELLAVDTIDHLVSMTPNKKIEELFFMDQLVFKEEK